MKQRTTLAKACQRQGMKYSQQPKYESFISDDCRSVVKVRTVAGGYDELTIVVPLAQVHSWTQGLLIDLRTKETMNDER